MRQKVSAVTIQPNAISTPGRGQITGIKATAKDANENEMDVATIDSSGFAWVSSVPVVANVWSVGLDTANKKRHCPNQRADIHNSLDWRSVRFDNRDSYLGRSA